MFSGIIPSATTSSTSLVLTNSGTTAGTATVTLYAADSGTQLATWTSNTIAPKASLLVDAAMIAAKAIPVLTTAQASQPVTLAVTSTFKGNAQYLSATSGVVSNLTPCGPTRMLTIGSVPGPGNLSNIGAVRLTNQSAAADHVVLTLYNSTDGTLLGTWTSPEVPANGSLTVSTTAIATAASPVVSATVASVTLSGPESQLMMQILSMPKAGGAVTSLNDACSLRGTPSARSSATDDSAED